VSVLVLGLNYKTAPIGLLERVAVPAEHTSKALAGLVARDHVAGAVVLSTCNRVEVYAHVTKFHGGMADLRNFFAEWASLAPEDFADLCYDHYDDRAAAHLFAVAGGLDSMVVGERQIATQIKQAFADAEREGTVGRVLGSLFRQALRVGRRVRSDTAISAGGASMVDVGLTAAERVLGQLDGRTVLLVGAGKMGGMAARRLHGRAGRLVIANRSAEKGERLALSVDGDVLDFPDLGSGLADADLVVSSTGASVPVIDQDTVAEAMRHRPGRPLALLDLAVPRDVDPGCSFVPGVTVLDVDAIRQLTTTGETGVEVAKARRIVEEEAARFAGWTRTVLVEPTVTALRQHAEAVRAAELERAAPRLSSLTDAQRDAVEAMTRGIVNTLLHDPTVTLKSIADARGGELHADVLRELFGLDDPA